jgi:Phosphotransferase enzyme family
MATQHSPPPAPTPLPPDEALPALSHVFDDEWVEGVWRNELAGSDDEPVRIVRRQLLYRPGSQAVVSYVAERKEGRWVLETPFAIELRANETPRAFRFPDDPYLPGLAALADPAEAQRLLPQYVALHPQRLRIETVRYRPTRRAVLRYETGLTPRRPSGIRGASLFVRVMQPRRVDRLRAAAELAQHSGFALPRIAGVWPEGGAAWLTEVPGKTVRSRIAKGKAPPPDTILEAIEALWAAPAPEALRGLALGEAYRSTERLLGQVLREDDEAIELLTSVGHALSGFVDTWKPASPAHNDFYDDQLVVAPDGRLFLVDFEEAGPGDPLLDIGNFLGHMRWMSRFRDDGAVFDAFGAELRERALERFAWSRRDLALRESSALFRLCTNPVRRLQGDWPKRTKNGLELALEAAGA